MSVGSFVVLSQGPLDLKFILNLTASESKLAGMG